MWYDVYPQMGEDQRGGAILVANNTQYYDSYDEGGASVADSRGNFMEYTVHLGTVSKFQSVVQQEGNLKIWKHSS